MKRSSDDVDALIREALTREEAELFEQLGEPSLPEMITEVFQGRWRWLMLLSMVVSTALTVLAVYCAVRFFQAREVREMLVWAAGGFFSLMAVLGNKIWYWMEMQRHSLSREIKRLELAVVHLAGELRDRERR